MSARAAIVALAPLLSGGCAALTTMHVAPGPFADRRPLPVAGTELFDWKGVVHCHGRLSHDSTGTLAEIAAAAQLARLDFLVMTDHQTDASIADGTRGMVGDTLFVVGAEVRAPQGTLLCFPLTRPLRRWQHVGLLVKEAAEQGALAFVCHGELWQTSWNVPGLCGAEIVNLHAGALDRDFVGTILTALFLPIRAVCERIVVRDPVIFAEWDRALARRHPCTPIGGNDAHANVQALGPLGGTIGDYPAILQTLSTHVLAPRGAAGHLDEASLVEAFAKGRTYVACDVFGEGAGFDFRVVDAQGLVHLGGDTVAADPGLRLEVTTPTVGRIALLRDGVEVDHRDATTFALRAPQPGLYRVEVRTPDGEPWLFSSSIRVR